MNLLVSNQRSGSLDELGRSEQQAPDERVLDSARQTLMLGSRMLERLAGRLDERFCRAASLLADCAGRVVVCGMGKSGHVARKLATTFSASGTPAFFMHPGEAAHGDLGMVTQDDVIVLVSRSGETAELIWLLPHFRGLNVPIVGLVGTPNSAIGRAATVVLDASVEREACPFGRIPTTSALAAMAVGDALALAVMTLRAVSPEHVARIHPGAPISGLPPAEQPAPPVGFDRLETPRRPRRHA